jgi:hypothetical protein
LQMPPHVCAQPAQIRDREIESTQRLAVTVAGQTGLALGNLEIEGGAACPVFSGRPDGPV